MDIIFLIGRILLGGYFLFSGINHLRATEALAGYAASKNVPLPKVSVILTGILMVLGGLGVGLGVFPHLALLLLILFMVPTTILMHDFWNAEGEARQNEQTAFLKNVGFIGALLMLLVIATPWMMSL